MLHFLYGILLLELRYFKILKNKTIYHIPLNLREGENTLLIKKNNFQNVFYFENQLFSTKDSVIF